MGARNRRTVFFLAAPLVIAAMVFASAASAASPPSPGRGCGVGATTANGVTTIPIKVLKRGEAVEALVGMCFAGKGPYPMVLDTGAEFTVITTQLAKELGLKPSGKTLDAEGEGCTTKSRIYELESASVGGVELEGSSIFTVDAPGRGPGQPQGSLGADVLSRFGSVKIDFKNETLTLGAEVEGPRFKVGQGPVPIPGALLTRKPKLTVPMRVESGPLGVRQTVKVKVGSTKPRPWLIDTGSTSSVIDPDIVERAHLKPTGAAHRTLTYCSEVTVPEYRAPNLTVSSARLKPQTIGSFDGSAGREGGILGAYPLWQYGSVVFDWPGAEMLLGVG